MGLKTRKPTNSRQKNPAPETTEPNNTQVTRPYPTHEEVQRRAYEIYLSQGGTDGRDMDNWLQAERELNQANGGTTSAPV
jgi:hypothetical protein